MTALKFNKVKKLPTSGYNAGDVFFVSSDKNIYIRTASGWEKYDGEFTTVMSGKVDKTLNVKSIEAITIKTGNTPDDKAANVAAIKAYVDNLTALGVEVTKGCTIPFQAGTIKGYVFVSDYTTLGSCGYGSQASNNSDFYNIFIATDGTFYSIKIQKEIDSSLATTSKQIVGAINEVNTLIKGKQDKLTSGTNIKTVNGQSLLGSGDVTISGGGSGDVTAAGDNTFTGNNVFSGIAIADILDGTQYNITGDNGVLMFAHGATNDDIEISGVATPTCSNSAANKKYVDDKVAAAGGSKPTIIDLDEIPTNTEETVSTAIFNTLANAAINKVPTFGYTNNGTDSVSNYEITPLTVKYFQGTVVRLMIEFILFNKHYFIQLSKSSDNQHRVIVYNQHSLVPAASVSNSSTNSIQSSAVWKEIHSEPMTVNTATSGVTTLSSTDKHKILCYGASGTQQYNLPASPVDGETFLFLKVKSGHAITIHSGTGNQNIYDCSSGNSVVSKTIATSTRRKITVTYSSTVGKWFLMADDFLS